MSTLRWADRLNEWLYRKFGAPYGVLLSIGLMIEIVRHGHEVIEHLDAGAAWRLLPIILNVALLLHTAGALHERLEQRARRRAAP